MPLPMSRQLVQQVRSALGLGALLVLVGATPARSVVVFSTDFESGLPAEMSAPGAVIEGVQGYAGRGPAGRQFGGNFLRYTSVPILPTVLTVRGLPPHDRLSVKFLLGLIDSWDGTELMQVFVDGSLRYNHWFQLALGDTTSYHPAPLGSILSMGVNLGFSNSGYHHRDRAYDLGVEPAFLDIPHTADSVTVLWTLSAVSGPAAGQWQGGADESWAIDALSVEVNPTTDVENGPFAETFAVSAVPNPAPAGSVRLWLSLPGPGAVHVELVDISGRRVASRDVEDAAAGSRFVDLGSEGRLGPGLYFARVKRGSESRTTRITVTE